MTPETFNAEVIQYLRPDGRQRKATISLPEEAQEDYQRMMDANCRLEAEVLQTEEVSVTIFDKEEETDIDCEITPNVPEVPAAIVKMLKAFGQKPKEAEK